MTEQQDPAGRPSRRLDALIPTQWKKGQSGNPLGGRHVSQRLSIIKAVAKVLAEESPTQGQTFLELAAKAAVLKLVQGDASMFRALVPYFDGLPGEEGVSQDVAALIREEYAKCVRLKSEPGSEDAEFTASAEGEPQIEK